MKKILLFLLCLSFMPEAFAQWSVGVKAGGNWGKLATSTDLLKIKNGKGWHIGAVANYSINPWFEMQGELLYLRQTTNDDIQFQSEGLEPYALNGVYQNINIPVLVQFYPFTREKNFLIQAGPQLGFSAGGSVKHDPERSNDVSQIPVTLYGDRNPVNFGLLFGCAYKLRNGLFLDFRYALGLTNYFEKEAQSNISFHERTLQLSIGYLFSL